MVGTDMLKILLLIAALVTTHHIEASPLWHWEETFSNSEKVKLQGWVLHAERGLTNFVGPLPYTYRVHYHHITRGSGPTPWAHTDKSEGRSVHFYVNTAYSEQDFKEDWTASHELSHLIFPYVGSSGRWFSEGLASYVQYQIMYANKTISWNQAIDNLEERFGVARKEAGHGRVSIVELSKLSPRTVSPVRLYWGGAAYFLMVDKALSEERNLRFADVIATYLRCCVYQKHNSAEDMMALFDRISGGDIFIRVYQQTVMRNGFPITEDSMNWLRKNPPRIR
jgi:hypothetical protein